MKSYTVLKGLKPIRCKSFEDFMNSISFLSAEGTPVVSVLDQGKVYAEWLQTNVKIFGALNDAIEFKATLQEASEKSFPGAFFFRLVEIKSVFYRLFKTQDGEKIGGNFLGYEIVGEIE